jgi:biotin operon repressor
MRELIERVCAAAGHDVDGTKPAPESMGEFVHAACKAAAAIVAEDKIITIAEYDRLTESVNALRQMVKDDPAQVSLWCLRALQQNVSFDSALRDLRKRAADAPPEVREAVVEALEPVTAIQGDRATEIGQLLQRALDVRCQGVLDELGRKTQSFSQLPGTLIGSVISHVGRDTNDRELRQVEDFARLFMQHDLLNALQAYRNTRSQEDLDTVRDELEQSREAVREHLEQLRTSRQRILTTRAAAETLKRVVDQLKLQTARRIQSVRCRAERQKQWFEEDIDRFLRDGATDVAHRLHRHTAMEENWTEKRFWEEFFQGEAGRVLKSRHTELAHRYDAMMENWKEELNSFNDELVLARGSVLEAIQEDKLGELVGLASVRSRALGGLDRGARVVTGTVKGGGALAMVGGAIVIGTGHVALLAKAGAVAAALVSNPVGWGALGVIGAAFVYQGLCDPDKRRVRELDGKHDEIKKGLRRMLGDASKAHQKQLADIVASFEELAQTQVAPLEREHQTLAELADLEERSVERVIASTSAQVEAVKLS